MQLATLIVTFALLMAQTAAPTEANEFKSPDKEVTILTAEPRGSTKEPIFDVTVQYKFNRRETVWLQGIGLVKSTGTVTYSLRSSRIIFFDKKGGRRIAAVNVAPTVVKQSPALGDPYPSSVAGWLPTQQLSVPVDEAGAWFFLSKAVAEAYNATDPGAAPCRPDDDGCLLTQWTSITAPSELLQAQMAVMMTYKKTVTPKGPTLAVKLFYILRQAPIGEKLHWDYNISDEIRKNALAKVAKVLNVLTQPRH